MAEALLASRLRDRGIDTVVESAGLAALVGRPADPLAQELMAARGLDLARHRARQLTRDLIRSFDVVLTMDSGQQRAVESLDPSSRGRVHRLGRVGGFDVPDPYGRGRAAFELALSSIERGLGEVEAVFWRAP